MIFAKSLVVQSFRNLPSKSIARCRLENTPKQHSDCFTKQENFPAHLQWWELSSGGLSMCPLPHGAPFLPLNVAAEILRDGHSEFQGAGPSGECSSSLHLPAQQSAVWPLAVPVGISNHDCHYH